MKRCKNIHGGEGKTASRLRWWIGVFLFLVSVHLAAQGVQIVQIGNIQLARSLAASVKDSVGTPMPNVLVEEFTSDWKQAPRSTKTDASGAFAFAPVKGRDVYYLQLRLNGFNPLRVRVKVDRRRGKALQLQLELST
jgi:hypothetical protein